MITSLSAKILQTLFLGSRRSHLLFPSLSASSVEEPLSFVVDPFSVLGVIEDFIRALERTVLRTKHKLKLKIAICALPLLLARELSFSSKQIRQ